MTPKVPRGRPQKRLPDQSGGWKSDEVLHVFRERHREFVGVGGCARAPPRTTFFLRERGVLQGNLSSVSLSVHNPDVKSRVFEARKSLVSLIGAPKRRVLACEKICELRCSRARQGQLYSGKRMRLRGRMAAPSEGNFAANLGQKPAQKGGTPLAGARGRPSRGGKCAPKVPRGRPQKRLPDQCGGWKSDEVLHFSAPGTTESLLEWGGASVRPRAEIFLRGRRGGAWTICHLSVCLSVRPKF